MAVARWKAEELVVVQAMFYETMGLIYEMNVRQKSGRTVVSTQNLELKSQIEFKSHVWSQLMYASFYSLNLHAAYKSGGEL